jgi:two-component system, cell cycle sensor histidine kinase and response regulator CckA
MSDSTAEIWRVLSVEDSPSDTKLLVQTLRASGRKIEFERVDTAAALRAALTKKTWDLVVSDWSMPKFTAPAALALVRELGLDIPFIIVSGTIGEDVAVDALRAGASDYVLKDKLGRLVPAVERELREVKVRAEKRAADEELRRYETERKKAEETLRKTEEQLRQAQKMEAVGRLAGGIAHDFNNVLSVILTYTEMILGDLNAGDPMRLDIEEIRKAGRRAADLTRQLLLFSRQQVLQPRVLDLNEIMGGMLRMLARILGADVDLVAVRAEPLGRVRVDPGAIEQVLMNLVVNARDAMSTGGKLTLETGNVVLDDAYAADHLGVKPGPHVMLAVTDTGTGIDKTTMARIFEPFFTTKEPGKGTGLGLSTVFGIVQQSGGSVWVYSEVGKGTTFKVYLPSVDAPPDRARPAASLAASRGTETILLVEDDEQLRAIANGILSKAGYKVIEARHAGEALLFAEREPTTIHLLLTDVVMPQMSGPELAKRLAPIRPTMKVLCMSGYTDDSIVRHGVLESKVAYLQKPITPQLLTARVREVLDS